MSGMKGFLGKELKEIARTWRLPVMASVVLLFALTGPVLALMTPQLLESLQSSQPGVVIQVPDPTWRDAYAQWVKNLTQIVAFVAIIVAAGSVAGEVASGTALLVLTKPVSRAGFVVAKALSLFALVAGCTVAGAAVTQGLTRVVFYEAPSFELWAATLAWLVFVALIMAATVVLSTVLPTLASAGAGVSVLFTISLAALWGPAVRYSPAGVMPAMAEILAGERPDLAWPLATSAVAAILLIALAAWIFSRREL